MQNASRTHNDLFSSVAPSVGKTPKRSTRSKWRQRCKNALSRVVMIASATMLIPFASDVAFASSFANSYESSRRLVSLSPSAASGQLPSAQIPVFGQSKIPFALVESVPQAALSTNLALKSASQQPSAALIDADNSWSLSYATQANTTQVNRAVQSVIAKVVADTTQAKACADSSCRRLSYIRSQLPVVTAKVQRLEEQLKDFSWQHGQGDIGAYKTAIANRISEVSNQKQQLDIELDQTRLRAEQLKSQLSSADVGINSAEQILAKDTIYQVLWAQLVAVEENIQKEYGQVNTDGTALNQLYGEYQTLLGKTQAAAREALNRYLLAGGSQTSDITYYPGVATETFGALLVETHQQKVQQLRQRKLAALEIGLTSRQHRLSSKLGEYERLQRELLSEQGVLDSYQAERDHIVATSPEAALKVSAIPTHNAQSFVAAQTLLPMLPSGSIAKTLLGIAVAASTLAAAAHRRSQKNASMLGTRILEILPTSRTASRLSNSRTASSSHTASSHTASSHTAKRVEAQPQMISLADITEERQTEGSAAKAIEIASAKEIEIVESEGSLEVLFATEEMPEQRSSFCVVNDLGEFEISESAVQSLDEFAVGIKADDFNQALEKLTPEDLLPLEINSRDIAPVRLPVAEADLFLDQALDWILEDLGLAALVASSRETNKTELVEDSAVDSVVADSVVADSVTIAPAALDTTTKHAATSIFA